MDPQTPQTLRFTQGDITRLQGKGEHTGSPLRRGVAAYTTTKLEPEGVLVTSIRTGKGEHTGKG